MTETANIRVLPLTGAAIGSAIEALARLRIEVFRAYPYLYEGTLDYERRYMEEFAASEGAVLVTAYDGERIVGASTASPMRAQKDEFRAPFEVRGFDIDRLFYFGESVLLPQYRGLRIGHAFFDHREAQARAEGATHATFCSVVRPPDHPARPADYRPHDVFWTKRRYAPVAGLVTHFSWLDVGESEETEKPMQFWLRALD
ncbi:hypothetical protein HDIA_3431 [Hartmannibacter diazotrophicus]|uniref:N-acetyltransferase domain-containing protein n=1 Tax=Hartmannibacter diazotrophicus TaxID=1482074 RepID=A0A2C9D9I5_9HYPH|nr:GNAT family N-acetyltransferase [Hartmannibacter diazotrophicus]SON56972.1 hypothetical protein HDIA_3431 [Hartmannibacter diazotrophicus]